MEYGYDEAMLTRTRTHTQSHVWTTWLCLDVAYVSQSMIVLGSLAFYAHGNRVI